MAARTLITGGSGLIGRALLRAWTGGPVDAPDRSAYDLLEPGAPRRLVDQERPDVVVHLAWCASGTPGYRTSTDNERWVRASVDLAAATMASGARFVGIGTVVDLVGGEDAYSSSKAALRARLEPDLAAGRIAWVRPCYVVDPDGGRPAVIAEARAALAEGRPARLAAPYAVHDFVHVDDVGRALDVVVAAELRGSVDVGSGRLTAVHTLVEALGCPWVEARSAAAPVGHDGSPADISPLTSRGWTPTATERLLAR